MDIWMRFLAGTVIYLMLIYLATLRNDLNLNYELHLKVHMECVKELRIEINIALSI